jgi:hypothetical protein
VVEVKMSDLQSFEDLMEGWGLEAAGTASKIPPSHGWTWWFLVGPWQETSAGLLECPYVVAANFPQSK